MIPKRDLLISITYKGLFEQLFSELDIYIVCDMVGDNLLYDGCDSYIIEKYCEYFDLIYKNSKRMFISVCPVGTNKFEIIPYHNVEDYIKTMCQKYIERRFNNEC